MPPCRSIALAGGRHRLGSVDADETHRLKTVSDHHADSPAAGLTQVRRDVQRREPHGVTPAFDPEALRARFALLAEATPSHKPTGPASARSSTRTPTSELAHTHSRSCTASTSPRTTTAPSPRSDGSTDLYETGELPEFHDIVNTIIARSTEILAWHHSDRASNGRIEETDNLLQVLRRTAHGLLTPANFEARGILVT